MRICTFSLSLRKLLFSFLIVFILSPNHSSAQTNSIILGRPTDKSITASILFDQDVIFFIDYGLSAQNLTFSSQTFSNKANVPDEIDLINLAPNTRYFYKLNYKAKLSSKFESTKVFSFYTQRARGNSFRFLVEADEHLYDKKGNRDIYKITLDNELKDSADFLISLGDIFGDDHTPTETTQADMDNLHKDYLQYLTNTCSSVPFYVCLGNHEGETGYYLKQTPPNNIGVYGTLSRKYYYPNPFPNSFYSGNTKNEDYGIGLPENYYAWEWGDALFVVLDVYRDCDVNDKPQNWDWTIGKPQYDWLKNTLEKSNAKYKFVFAHHNRGQGRGGIVPAKGNEWGGYEINKNTWEFDKYRPGWELPIHQLMVKNGVNIFFQGHDHLYAKEMLDGIVYQEVPMPSDSSYEIGYLANADAYTDVTLRGTGHIRVNVSDEEVVVDFVSAFLPKDTLSGKNKNGAIAYSYKVNKSQSSVSEEENKDFSVYFDNSNEQIIFNNYSAANYQTKLELIDLQGTTISSQDLNIGSTVSTINAANLHSGVYIVKYSNEYITKVNKIIIMK